MSIRKNAFRASGSARKKGLPPGVHMKSATRNRSRDECGFLHGNLPKKKINSM